FTMAFALCIYCLAGLSSGMVLKRISGDTLSDNELFVHWMVFVTYPIVSEQMVYPILVMLALGYLLVPLALYLCWKSFNRDRIIWQELLLAVILLTFAIDFYESYASVFLTFLAEAVCLAHLNKKDNSQEHEFWRPVFSLLVKSGCVLVVAVVLRQIINMLFMFTWHGTWHSGYSGNSSLYWLAIGWFDCAFWLVRTMSVYYFWASACNLSIFIFTCCWIAWGIAAVVKSICERSIRPMFIALLLIASAVSLSLVLGLATPYRMGQALVPFVAFSIMMLYVNSEGHRWLHITACMLIALLVMNSIKSLSDWSYINYKRYEYEMALVDRIGFTLQKEFPIDKKPVVFAGGKNAPYLPETLRGDRRFPHPLGNLFQKGMLCLARHLLPAKFYRNIGDFHGLQINNEQDLLRFMESLQNPSLVSVSYLSWLRKHKSWYDKFEPELPGGHIYGLFQEQGYPLLRCTDAQYDESISQSKNLPAYPAKGSIVEMDDRIIVNFGE
ncbi:MAG: glucosyltransferase domain-containing protein, partial [Bacteroidaceae bacterium]|nr:glucosyltransferase domain-containing protein [Bacteroidaceae bacterium]